MSGRSKKNCPPKLSRRCNNESLTICWNICINGTRPSPIQFSILPHKPSVSSLQIWPGSDKMTALLSGTYSMWSPISGILTTNLSLPTTSISTDPLKFSGSNEVPFSVVWIENYYWYSAKQSNDFRYIYLIAFIEDIEVSPPCKLDLSDTFVTSADLFHAPDSKLPIISGSPLRGLNHNFFAVVIDRVVHSVKRVIHGACQLTDAWNLSESYAWRRNVDIERHQANYCSLQTIFVGLQGKFIPTILQTLFGDSARTKVWDYTCSWETSVTTSTRP